jgi:nitrous oxidase accessory protein NosD
MSTRTRSGLQAMAMVLAGIYFWPATSDGRPEAQTHTLECGPTRTISHALKILKPGDTLLVSGTCNENVVIGQEIARVTLDGQGTATLNGDPSGFTITVTGAGVTVRGFTIRGGQQGIAVLDGGSAVIDGNVIEDAVMNGITVFRNSTARIVNNVIQNNASSGIQLQHGSSAQIGFSGPPTNRISGPNTIQNNGAPGIQVLRGSSAQIFSNTIRGNRSHGILVDRNAQAEIGACVITGNTGDGIRGVRGAGIDTGTDATGATPRFDDDTNTGSNGGFGVSCTIDGFVDGRLGTLTGASGGKQFSEGCVDSLLN